MGELVFVEGDRSVDLGVKSLQPVGVAPNQISASLARPRRREAADVAREGSGCYAQAALRRSRRGGRSRRDRKQPKPPPPPPPPQQQSEKKTILKRLSPTDLASLAAAPPAMSWDYEARLRELQRQREWYLMNTAAPDPYFPLAPDLMEDWSPRRPSRCHECEAAAAAMREPAFHWCVRDAVTVGFRSPVGPIQRPPKKTPSPPPASTPFLGMSVY